MLGNVSPGIAAKNALDARQCYTEVNRHRFSCDDVSKAPNFTNVIFCQYNSGRVNPTTDFVGMTTKPMLLSSIASRADLWADAMLPSGVSGIVAVIPEKQMLWAAARRVVAVVADFKPLRDRAISQHPSQSMGIHRFGFTNTDLAITAPVVSFRPNPAARFKVNQSRPQTVREWSARMKTHRKALPFGVTPPGGDSRRGGLCIGILP